MPSTITVRALTQRVQRAIAPQKLRCRHERYSLISPDGTISRSGLNLLTLAHDLGCIAPNERLSHAEGDQVDADGHYQTPSDAENRAEATLHQTLPVPAAVPDAILSRLEKLEEENIGVLDGLRRVVQLMQSGAARDSTAEQRLAQYLEDRTTLTTLLEGQTAQSQIILQALEGLTEVAREIRTLDNRIKALEIVDSKAGVKLQALAEVDTQPSYIAPISPHLDFLAARVDRIEATVMGLCAWASYSPYGGEEEAEEVEPAETLEQGAPAIVSDLSAPEVAKLLKGNSLEHRMYPNPDGTWRFDTLKTVSRHTGAVRLGVKGKEGRTARDAVAFGLYRLVGELISREQYGECSPADVALLNSLRGHSRPYPPERLDPIIPISRPPQKPKKRGPSSAKYKPTKKQP